MNKLIPFFICTTLALHPRPTNGEEKKETEKSSEKASEKGEKKPRRLGGEFKGHPVETAPAGNASGPAPKEEKKPAAASPPANAPKQIVIDNAMVKSGSPEKEKSGKAAPPAPSPPASVPPVSYSAPVDLNGHDEGYWKQKAASVRAREAEAERALEAARQEEKREENDFYAWDDGQYRDNVIKPAWEKARQDTAKAEEELKASKLELDNLEDDARKAGALPGWIRE